MYRNNDTGCVLAVLDDDVNISLTDEQMKHINIDNFYEYLDKWKYEYNTEIIVHDMGTLYTIDYKLTNYYIKLYKKNIN